MGPAPRLDGFAAIEDYAALGDGRTVALVASDGRVDWWPVPALDAPPACAAILDPERGGYFALAPVGPHSLVRRYLPESNVLETTYSTAGGRVRVTDSLNSGRSGRLPWTELARRVEGEAGEVELAWRFEPGDRFGSAQPWVASRGGVATVVLGDQRIALVLEGSCATEVGHRHVAGLMRSAAGRRGLVCAVAADRQPVFVPEAADVHGRIDASIDSWRRWAAGIDYSGPWRSAVIRSALALKLLFSEDNGAIAAAATTSLPEVLGGAKNWDYRYAWVRDASFTLDALIGLGLHEEVQASTAWLLAALRRTAPDLHVFYSLDGSVADEHAELDVAGYRGSRPVRAGNSAAGQTQLGVYGDLFDTIRRYVEAGHHLDAGSGQLLADLADRCCDSWRHRDSGIWELQRLEHYTISKIGCWVALDRAAWLADTGQLATTHAERWRGEAAEVRKWVEERCWSARRQAYAFYAGSDDLDAAVLLAGRTGFERGERLRSTIEAIVAELGRGSLLYRYSGMPEEEGAFVACSFWLVDALVRTGQLERARAVMGEAVALGGELGLLAEEIDPETGAFLGNTPQGLSHLALIAAAHALAAAPG